MSTLARIDFTSTSLLTIAISWDVSASASGVSSFSTSTDFLTMLHAGWVTRHRASASTTVKLLAKTRTILVGIMKAGVFVENAGRACCYLGRFTLAKRVRHCQRSEDTDPEKKSGEAS